MSFEDYVNSKETREKLIKERALLSAYPIANQSKIKVIDELLASLPNDEDYEEERGCATYLFSNDEPEKIYEENIPEEPKTTLKEKISNTIGFWLLISPFIIIPVVSLICLIFGIYFSFDNIVNFLNKIGSGFWFVGLIIVSFAIITLVQILRGAILLSEVDADKFGLNERKQDWKVSLYCVINLLGYAALYIFLKRI